MKVKEYLKAEAQRLGFDLIGVTTPHPMPGYPRFESWLESGLQARMAYLDTPRSRKVRQNPAFIMETCLTIVVVGMSYPSPIRAHPDQDGATAGRIAAYAWGEDYHNNIPPRLEALAHAMEGFLGKTLHYTIYTDTGPILEKELGQRAGIGWIGKNSCLIDPHSGSFFLLGELFLDVEIEPDSPLNIDYCGNCRRCIEACPTDCILPDRTLDAGRCISYLTIENKEAIPEKLRSALGDWVFGCDICQMVCPWNIRFSPDIKFENSISSIPIVETLGLSNEDFKQRYKNRPISRARRRGLVRNAAIAAGNIGTADVLRPLVRVLREDEEPLARISAAWALGKVRGDSARAELEQALGIEPDLAVRTEIEMAVKSIVSRKPKRE